jgi:hypothetical protein
MTQHYLLTLSNLEDQYLHAYLMTEDESDMERVLSKMADILGTVFPVGLATVLSPDGVKVIREMLADEPEVKAMLDTATNFHVTIWQPLVEDDHKKLMELH